MITAARSDPAGRAAVFVAGLLLVAASHAADTDDSRLADAAMHRDMALVRTLIREGADVDSRGDFDTPALLWTARIEDQETLLLLLAAGADPDAATPQGLTALHQATENGDVESVRTLLEFGADPNLTDGAGETALMIASRGGFADIATLLIRSGAAVDVREHRFHQSALHIASRYARVDVARVLIDHGADVNAVTLAGETPRMRLPDENRGSKGVGIVRGGWPEHGMRYATPGAKTALLYATRAGSARLVDLLLDAGADIEHADADGIRPLLNAIINASVAGRGVGHEHIDVALDLIARGAEVNAPDWFGETPLWAAVDVRNLDITGPDGDNGVDRDAILSLIRRLLEAGADPNARTREYPPERRFITRLGSLSWVDFTGQTPFLRAALAGDVDVMQLLLDSGADPNIATFGGTTPLMAAAGVNWVVSQTYDEGPKALLAAVKLAHASGNPIDAVNSMGLSAVHGAANRGSNEIIEYLAANGAALDRADNEGRTPLDWAGGVFLATHPPVRKPETIALLESLLNDTGR